MLQSDHHKIVILETNRNRRDYLRGIVSNKWWVPIIFEKETICLDNLRQLEPDLVISGPLSNDRMYRFVNTVKMMDAGLPVLVLSNDPSLKEFASFYGYGLIKVLESSCDSTELISAIGQLILQRFADGDTRCPENFLIIGNSPEMLKIKRSIPELCRLSDPVLIQGEPGTGKELVARAIHHHSERRTRPFVKINLAELNARQLDEVLFGAVQGSFVDSNQRFRGLYRPAEGGTLLLDEIAEFPVSFQSRLLSVFENGILNPDHTAPNGVDLKIIVSSSKILDRLVQQGKFREDLYFRMNTITIEMPPLRKRISDIPLLTDFFADKICLENKVGYIEVPAKLKESFCRYPWPGNVRELKTIVHRTIMYGIGDSAVQKLATQWEKPSDAVNFDQDIYALVGLSNLKNYLQKQNNLTLKKVRRVYLLRTEKKIIKKALEKTNWNRKNAAELLEISYKSLLNKIKEYQLVN
ncbi:hypothetical protein D1AOALGA4SA_10265 [Olavius algarvensis Delta 1 endosymbiont]|nr:hypothetical protein D1AOALGA4SA_10265 [Olavius algarvensis Delta 1 endosymbiont]